MARVARSAPAPAAAAERFFSNAFLMQLERLAFVCHDEVADRVAQREEGLTVVR